MSDSGDLFRYLRVIMLEPATTIGHMWPLGEASASFISRPLALHGQSLASRYGLVSLLISLCIAADCVKNAGAALTECFGHNYRCCRIVHLFDKSHSRETSNPMPKR